MTTVTLGRGYRLPKLRQQLKQADGTPVPLTGASVRLLMGIPGKPRKVAAAATILDAANGIVEYAWAAGDVDTVGVYLAEWGAPCRRAVARAQQRVSHSRRHGEPPVRALALALLVAASP